MENQRQFSLANLLAALTVSVAVCWLYVTWWQLLLLIAISFLPAALVMLLINRMRKESHFFQSTVLLFLFAGFFLALYVLSGGPMMYVDVTCLTVKGGESNPELLTQFYEPLEILNTPLNPFKSSIDSYYEQWQDYCGIITAG